MCIVLVITNKHKTIYKPLPKLTITKKGIKFCSNSRHRLYIDDAKTMQVGNIVYLKKGYKTIILKNVDNVYIKNKFIYFTTMGKCEIMFDIKSIYKYFKIEIKSNKFDLSVYKQKAIKGMVDNVFEFEKNQNLLEYLKIVTKILNIRIKEKGIIIKQNQFKLPFEVKYVCNNIIKTIKINQSI